MVADLHRVQLVCVVTDLLKEKKMGFFEDGDFFQNWKFQSYLNSIGNGAEIWPLRAPKNPCGFSTFD